MKIKKQNFNSVVLAFASIIFSSFPSFAGVGIWPSNLEMKKHLEQSTFVDGKRGETRGFDKQFQAIINAAISIEEQESIRKAMTLEDGTYDWSFEANKQVYTWIDLNDDGLEDVMLQFYHTAVCGSAGCESYLLLHTKEGFKKLQGFMTDSGFSIAPHISNGFKTVFAIEECAIWDGQKYNYKSGPRDKLDNEWNPHACGGNYQPGMLKARSECKECHHK